MPWWWIARADFKLHGWNFKEAKLSRSAYVRFTNQLSDFEVLWPRTRLTGLADVQDLVARFEKVYTTIYSVRDTMKYIASSPAVRDFEEFVIGLYTPEGDAIALSTGIMVHVHTLSEFIKFMIRNGYEDDPKIRPGDIL